MAGFEWNTFYVTIEAKMKKACPGCKVGRYVIPKPADFPYCDVALEDISGGNYDLEGNEGSTNPLIVLTVYSTGSLADAICGQISSEAKAIMLSYGFQCKFGPKPVVNAADPSIVRWVARYQRVFASGDELKQVH